MKRWIALGVVAVAAALMGWRGAIQLPAGASTKLPITAMASPGAGPDSKAAVGLAAAAPGSARATAPLPTVPVSRSTEQGNGDDNEVVQRAMRLLSCSDVQLTRMRRHIDDSLQNLAGLDERLKPDAPKPLAPVTAQQLVEARQSVVDLLEESRKALAACEALPEAERRSGMALLQRAAEMGVADARIAYARNAFDEYPSAQALMANLDEVVRRRELVRRFLAESMGQCDPEVWSARFDLRDILTAGSRDAAAQVAIIQAYYSAELARGEEAAHLQHVRDTLDAAAQSLDAAARDAAMRQGEAAVARCAAVSH